MSEFETQEFYQDLVDVARQVFSQDIASGLQACQDAAQKYPESGKVICLLGVAANLLGDQGQAAQLLDKAYNLEPDSQEIVNANAVILARSGKLNDSLFFAKLATALEPHDIFSRMLPKDLSDYALALQNVNAPMHGVFAMIEFEHGNYVECIHACERQLKVNNADWDTHVLMAKALIKLDAPQRAIGTLQMVIALADAPTSGTYSALGEAYLALGDTAHAWTAYGQSLQLAKDEEYRGVLASLLSRQSSFGPRYLQDFQEKYVQYYHLVDDEAEILDLFGGGEDLEGRKVRVGIISDQFFDSLKAPFLELVLREYDNDVYELYGYQQNAIKDSTTSRFANMVDGWREIEPIDPDTAAFMMASDGLDILIDTVGASNPAISDLVAQKPAPVIINWLTDANGTTSGAVDFVLASQGQQALAAAVHGEADVLSVNGPAVGFDGDALSILLQRAAQSPSSQNGFMTYGALLTPEHSSADFVNQCAQVLRQNKENVLVLAATGLGASSYRNWVVEQFATYGVAGQIQIVELNSYGFEDLSGFLMGVDMFFANTHPDNQRIGLAALLSGVPVMALASTSLSTDVLPDVLNGMGKADWVIGAQDSLADVVKSLSADQDVLETLREELSDILLDSPICDEDIFIENFEAALQDALTRKKLI